MSDNLSHEQQEDWEQWIDWMDTQDWDSVGLGLDCDDATGVSGPDEQSKSGSGYEARVSLPLMGIPVMLDSGAESTPPVTTPDLGVVSYLAEDAPTCTEDETDVTVSKSVEAGADDTKGTRRDYALQCTASGCTYQGTFPRRWELQRHVRVKHECMRKFRCHVIGCFKGPGVTSFARSDKLTDHIRATHRTDAMTKCPNDDCPVSLPLDLLIMHIKYKHRRNQRLGFRSSKYDQFTEDGKSVMNVANRRKCIYWDCSARLHPEEMLDHLETHSSAELERMQDDLLDNGYLVVLPSETSKNPEVGIVCPICDEQNASQNAFNEHLFGSHLADHEKIGRLSKVIDPRKIMQTVLKGGMKQRVDKDDLSDSNIQCPGCEEAVHIIHECSLIRKEIIPEVKTHRQLLLRLCPQFGEEFCNVPFGSNGISRKTHTGMEAFFDDL